MSPKFVQEHFRCLDEIGGLAWPPLDTAHAGFFRLGRDAVLYGRLAHGHVAGHPEHAREDALAAAQIKDGECRLPFDPGEALKNLLCERYPGAGRAAGAGRRLRRAAEAVYYSLRPMLPVAVRKHLQRAAVIRNGGPRHDFPAWPVDTTVEKLLDRLLWLAMRARGLERTPFIWFWPEGHVAATTMTHDVETASGRDFTPQLMDLNDRHGLKASIEVIPEQRYEVPEPWLRAIRERGFEIAVHDLNHDGRLFSRHDEFLRRVAKINAYGQEWGARGFRSGVLYRNTDWLRELRFAYDMSVPNGGHFQPQSGGCCTVRPFFNGELLEIPNTAVQDYVLFHILGDYTLALWERQIETIAAAHGLLSFSCHPDYLMEPRARGVYTALLERLAELRQQGDWWFARPGEVNDWWRARHRLRLVRAGDEWRIEGPGAERARLAFAEARPEGLAYALPAGAPTVAYAAARSN